MFRYFKACRKGLRQTTYRGDKDQSPARALKKDYGLSAQTYRSMCESQEGRCAICGTPASETTGKRQRLRVDHDHRTGMVRDLLCASCNRGRGVFFEDPAIFQISLKYLARWQERQDAPR